MGWRITVEVDGAGLRPGHQAGVGLRSMRERAEELGGELRVEPQRLCGTRVWARLPIAEKMTG